MPNRTYVHATNDRLISGALCPMIRADEKQRSAKAGADRASESEESMSPSIIERERASVRSALLRRQLERQAQALQSMQAAERRAEREAWAEIRRDGRITQAGAAERRAMLELAAAKRRDALTRSLAYPMSGAELVAACQHATLAAKVSADAFEDVSQALAEYVIRRHGPHPERVRVSAEGLRKLASTLYLEKRRKDERANGQRAAAEELADWRDQDHRAAMSAAAAAGGDLVWAVAAGRPAPVNHRPLAAGTIARMLTLSDAQAAALAVAINTSRVRPLRNAERVAWHAARAALRTRYPDPEALRLAIRPERYAAEMLADAAIRAERKRADVASRTGSHGGGQHPSASTVALARFHHVAAGRPDAPGSVGPERFPRPSYGDGYGGACSILYVHRGARRKAQAT